MTSKNSNNSDSCKGPIIGIKEINLKPTIKAYPNPTQNLITFEVSEKEGYNLKIYNLLGEEIIS